MNFLCIINIRNIKNIKKQVKKTIENGKKRNELDEIRTRVGEMLGKGTYT